GVVDDEGIEVTHAVRDEPELEAGSAQQLEHRHGVLVQVEVAVLLPRLLDRDGALTRAVALAAHAADDPLRERDPDLLVVLEVRVTLEVDERRDASLLVPGWVELQAELLASAAVALRAELGPRLREREVDVEEDGAELAHASTSQRTVSTCRSCHSLSYAHASVWA